jgi:hypothetical protein
MQYVNFRLSAKKNACIAGTSGRTVKPGVHPAGQTPSPPTDGQEATSDALSINGCMNLHSGSLLAA